MKGYKNLSRSNVYHYLVMISTEIKQMLKREVGKFPITPTMRRKISENKFFIPLLNEKDEFAKYNYNVAQLKKIAKHYKLPVSGTKSQLTNIIFNFLQLSEKCVVIQRHVRGHFARKGLAMRGPALSLKNRTTCTNETDFFSLTPINEIPWSQFYSFKCEKGFIYGFDIASLAQMFVASSKNNRKISNIMNPYNRDIISKSVYKSLKTISKLSKLFGMNTIIMLAPEQNEIIETIFDYEQKILNICQILDGFGNYTNTEWFTNLSRHNIIKCIREVHDIWTYRAQLSYEIKKEICPPHGNPFLHLRNANNMLTTMNDIEIKKAFVKIIENMIQSANDDSNRSLGGMYVLTALTIISPAAATAMPWLYDSVMV